MPSRTRGLLSSRGSPTGLDSLVFRFQWMFDMLSPVGLPKLTLLSWIHVCWDTLAAGPTHTGRRGACRKRHMMKKCAWACTNVWWAYFCLGCNIWYICCLKQWKELTERYLAPVWRHYSADKTINNNWAVTLSNICSLRGHIKLAQMTTKALSAQAMSHFYFCLAVNKPRKLRGLVLEHHAML